jgi:septal ring factor EnvC (AmiA/AmiB activator)
MSFWKDFLSLAKDIVLLTEEVKKTSLNLEKIAKELRDLDGRVIHLDAQLKAQQIGNVGERLARLETMVEIAKNQRSSSEPSKNLLLGD